MFLNGAYVASQGGGLKTQITQHVHQPVSGTLLRPWWSCFLGPFCWCVCVSVGMKKLNPVISVLVFFILHPELMLVP